MLDASGNAAFAAAVTVAGNATVTGNATITGTLQANGVTGTLYPLVLGTAVASTSGTAIDFTGIPSWVRRVTVMFNGVSTNGSSEYLIQLGAGSFLTSGYNSYGMNFGGASGSGAGYTAGFGVRIAGATRAASGSAIFSLVTGNTWTSQHSFASGSTTDGFFGAGGVTLGGTLDRVRITTAGGTDTFDAGSINLLWE